MQPTDPSPSPADTSPPSLPTALSDSTASASHEQRDELKAAASEVKDVPLWKDFAYFLLHNKKWWLIPLLVVLLLLSLMMALSSTAVAPFIYTVF